jgi:nicotinamidase-related amidase
MSSHITTFNAAHPSTPDHYRSSQTALLLLDFHSMYVQMAGGAGFPSIVKVAAQMRTWARSQGIQVIHCLVDVNTTPFPTCKDADMFSGFLAAMKQSGGVGEPAELLDGDGADTDVTFFRRPGYVSALKSPGLDEFLKKKGIKSLVLTGLSTSSCVMRTSIAASDAEYVVSVISDGCADLDIGAHEFILKNVLNDRGYTTTATEFQKGFKDTSSGR